MSVETIAIALHHSRARGSTKLVMLGIANHDGDGGAWPSIATLSKYAGDINERTVRRCIEELVALGEIEVAHNEGGTRQTPNDRRPNLYHVLLTCPPTCDGTKNHHERPSAPSPARLGTTPPDRRKRAGVDARPSGDGRAQTSGREGAGARHGRVHTPPEPSMNHPRTTPPPTAENESHLRNARASNRDRPNGGSTTGDAARPPGSWRQRYEVFDPGETRRRAAQIQEQIRAEQARERRQRIDEARAELAARERNLLDAANPYSDAVSA